MHKKYVTKKGKKFGPYYYTTIRDENGVARSYYLSQDRKVAERKERELKQRMGKADRNPTVSYNVTRAGIAMAIVVLALAFTSSGHILGFFIQPGLPADWVVHKQNVGLIVEEDSSRVWELSKHPEQFYLKSVKVSGKLMGDGDVRVWLEYGAGARELLLDTPEIERNAAGQDITGMVIGPGDSNETDIMEDPVVNGTETVPEANETMPEMNRTVAMPEDETEPEWNETEPETNDTMPEMNQTEPETNQTILDPELNATEPGMNETEPGLNMTFPEEGTAQPGVEEDVIEVDERKKIKFDELCVNTCMLPDGVDYTSYSLVFEVGPDTTLDIKHITYTLIDLDPKKEANVSYKKIKDDPVYDVYIDSTRMNKKDLVVVFHHDSDRAHKIFINGDINYTLDREESMGFENATLTVHEWNEEYFEIYVGEHTEIIAFGPPSALDLIEPEIIDITKNESLITLNDTVKDSSGNYLEVDAEIYDSESAKLLNLTEINSTKGETYTIVIKPRDHVIEEIKLINASITDISDLVEIEEANETQGFLFSVNPLVKNASIAIVANGTDLPANTNGFRTLDKCADWDFQTGTCNGEWVTYASLTPDGVYNFTMDSVDPGFNETVSYCVAEDDASKGSFGGACDYSDGSALETDGGTIETHTYGKGDYAGVKIESVNTSITDCAAISKVEICYEWWSTNNAAPADCDVSVDANNGASFTAATTSCPGSSANPGVTCTDVTSLESWACSSFFGASGTRAQAKSEMTRTGSGGPTSETATWDVLYFNVTYNQSAPNNVPVVQAKTITPASPYTTEDLRLNVTCTDADSGDTITAYWDWHKDSQKQASLAGSQTISNNTNTLVHTVQSGNTTKNEQWIAEVWCGDGTANTSKTNATAVTIQNTAPTIGTPTVNDTTPYTNNIIECNNGSFTDADSDTATWHYKWYDTGALVSGQASNTLDLSTSGLDKGDNITCSAIADDGTVNASNGWQNSTNGAVIQNTLPLLTTDPALNGTNPADTATMKCNNGTFYDEDGDSETDYWKWFKNGAEQPGHVSQTLSLPSVSASPGDTIKCAQMVGDGEANSSWHNSSNTATVQDNEDPAWSGNQTSIPGTYSPSTSSYFNVTWNDNGNMHTALIEGNWSGSPQNYSMNDLGSGVYGYSQILPAGTFYWKSWANDTAGNDNITDTWVFTISKSPSAASLIMTPPSPITYGTQANASCSGTNPEASSNLYRNGTQINSENNQLVTLAAGSYDYVCNVTSTQNYTAASNSTSYAVNQVSDAITLYINGNQANQTIPYGTQSNATAYSASGTGQLFRDGAPISNPEISTLGAGTYAYKANSTGSQNYTANATGVTRYLTVNQATSSCSLTFDKASPQAYGTALTATCSCTNPEANAKLYRNSTDVTSSENGTATTLPAGTHNYVCNVTSTQNYTSATNSSGFTVSKATLSLTLASSPSWSETYGTQTTVNCTSNTPQATPTLQRNGTTVSIPDTQTLAAGTHNYTCSAPATQNYTADTEANNMIISKADPGLSLTVAPASPISYGTQSNASCTFTASEGSAILRRNGIVISSPDVQTLGASSYNYSCIFAATQNYTADSTEQVYQVNKASTATTLYIDGSQSNKTITYGTQSNASAHTTAGSVAMYRNSQPVSSPEIDTLAAGIYNYTAINPGNQNYTSSSAAWWLTINQATSSCSLTFDKASPQAYGTALTATCSCTNPEANAKLYRNSTDVTSSENGTATTLPAGTHNYVCNVTSSQNYTSAANSSGFTVSKAASSITLLLNGTDGNLSVSAGDTVNITAYLNSGEGGIQLYQDSGMINSGQPPLTNLTSYNATGEYNITAVYSVTENYTASTETNWVKLLPESVPPSVTNLVAIPNPVKQNQTTSITANVTDSTNISSVIVQINDSNGTVSNYSMSNSSQTEWYYLFTPSTGDPTGVYTVRVIASDYYNNKNNTEAINLTVSYMNHPPVIAPIANITVNETDIVFVNATATDNENDTINFSYSPPLNSTGQWLTTYDSAGTYTFTVYATDGYSVVSRDVYVTVNNVVENVSVEINVLYSGSDHDLELTDSGIKVDGVPMNRTTISTRTESQTKTLGLEKDTYDFKIEPDSTASVTFNSTQMFQNETYDVKMDADIDASGEPSHVIFKNRAFSTSPMFNTTNSTVCFNTSGITFHYPDNKAIYKCSWNFVNGQCTGGWTMLNVTEIGDQLCAVTTNFSAFVMAEIMSYCGDDVCDDDESCSGCPADCGTCPTTPSGSTGDTGGGGGGGGAPSVGTCEEYWSCSEWGACMNGSKSRTCTDKNYCGTTDKKPVVTRLCGEAAVEAACSNNVQDQGETGVDCGGPCGPCPAEVVRESDFPPVVGAVTKEIVTHWPYEIMAVIIFIVAFMMYRIGTLKNVERRQKRDIPKIMHAFKTAVSSPPKAAKERPPAEKAHEVKRAASKAQNKLEKQLNALDTAFKRGYITDDVYTKCRHRLYDALKEVKKHSQNA
jgi:hypothetical protein